MTTTSFTNIRLLSSITSPSSLYDVLCSPSGITSILPASTPPSDLDDSDQKEDHLPQLWDRTTLVQEEGITVVDGKGSWLMPGLNHPHLHLDKSYLLGKGPSVPGSSHSCGIIETGDFSEAMSKTLKAKSLFTPSSVTSRSRTLLSLSLSCGVTSLTTHVEVDPSLSPPNLSLLSALELKRSWKGRIDIRIVVFAQEACFVDGEVGEERRRVIEEACEMEGVDAVGSAPYVEKAEEGDEVDEGDPTGGRGARNVEWVFELAERRGLDVDFHLDYDLNPSRHPLIWTVLAEARSQPAFHLPSLSPSTTSSSHPPSSLPQPPNPTLKHRTLTLGHTTHLSLLTPAQLSLLETKARGLDVTFVALPTSDLYMMGRDAPSWRERGRGSFDVWELERRGMKVLMGLNNISNLFTPSSNPDPLSVLPSLSIPLFQSALPSSQLKLLEMIVLPRTTVPSPSPPSLQPSSTSTTPTSSSTSISPPSSMSLEIGSKADLVLVHGSTSVREVVGNPGWGRTVVKEGRVVARREGRGWIASD